LATEIPKPLICSVHPAAWPDLMVARGHAAYRGRQLAGWLYGRGATTFDTMTSLPAALRDALADDYDLTALTTSERQVSTDGTRKFLFRLRDGETVESVMIPMERHVTFCLSSQVGCAMACRFCATARGGLVRNLTAGEIVEQVLRLRDDLASAPQPGHGKKQYNIVLMGMGEPLDNWDQVQAAVDIFVAPEGLGISPRRIQLSTAAPVGGLQQLAEGRHPIGLTISLGGATDAQRRRVMPIAGRESIAKMLTAAERYARRIGRHATVAYVLIAGVTDDLTQARQIARLLQRRPFKVNLIPLNRLDDDTLAPTATPGVLAFQKVLIEAGVPARIRTSGGQDIAAACGQLRRRRRSRPGDPRTEN